MAGDVPHTAIHGLLLKKFTQEHRIEMEAVPHVERKTALWPRRLALARQPRGNEEAVRVRVHVGAVEARVHVVEERRHRHVVQHGRERVEITFVTRPRGPALERDAGLIGGVALWHPFGFLDAETLEK